MGLTNKDIEEIKKEILHRAEQCRMNHGAGSHVQYGYDSKAEGLEEALRIVLNSAPIKSHILPKSPPKKRLAIA